MAVPLSPKYLSGKRAYTNFRDTIFAVPADEKPERVQILAGRGRIISITPDSNTNLMAPRTRITAAKYKVRKGEMRIVTEFSRENDG